MSAGDNQGEVMGVMMIVNVLICEAVNSIPYNITK